MKKFATFYSRYFLFIFLTLFLIHQAFAVDSYTDWGEISSFENTTIDFANTDITQNFTDEYAFSVQSGTDTSYAVTVSFDVCKNGCGNVDVDYGIYDAQGSIISDTGTATLVGGNYVLRVKGTGMGSGNQLDYFGSVSFYVSAVPEPAGILLLLTSIALLAGALYYRRRKNKTGEKS